MQTEVHTLNHEQMQEQRVRVCVWMRSSETPGKQGAQRGRMATWGAVTCLWGATRQERRPWAIVQDREGQSAGRSTDYFSRVRKQGVGAMG